MRNGTRLYLLGSSGIASLRRVAQRLVAASDRESRIVGEYLQALADRREVAVRSVTEAKASRAPVSEVRARVWTEVHARRGRE